MNLPSKQDLKDELVRGLAEQLEAAERAHRAMTEAATHEEAKPENDKDTRALEQSYLARGQALRVEELRAGLAGAQRMSVQPFATGAPVALGALVLAEEQGRQFFVFVAPSGGGVSLAGKVQVLTPQSSLGRALLGKCEGDDCEAQVAGRVRELSVVRVV